MYAIFSFTPVLLKEKERIITLSALVKINCQQPSFVNFTVREIRCPPESTGAEVIYSELNRQFLGNTTQKEELAAVVA